MLSRQVITCSHSLDPTNRTILQCVLISAHILAALVPHYLDVIMYSSQSHHVIMFSHSLDPMNCGTLQHARSSTHILAALVPHYLNVIMYDSQSHHVITFTSPAPRSHRFHESHNIIMCHWPYLGLSGTTL